jgi:hypothetical protein
MLDGGSNIKGSSSGLFSALAAQNNSASTMHWGHANAIREPNLSSETIYAHKYLCINKYYKYVKIQEDNQMKRRWKSFTNSGHN